LILHNDGKRELYWFRRADDDEPSAVITLDDDEARQLGAVLGGAYQRPKIVEELEMALGELSIEWVAVPDSSPLIGKTLAEAALRAKTGITIIAILREPEPVSGAQPNDVIKHGDTLVTVGKAGQYGAFHRMLEQGATPG
jgi:TrkA domain protein